MGIQAILRPSNAMAGFGRRMIIQQGVFISAIYHSRSPTS